jgi:glycosyltransferase involved in cell wall biosynthesis
MTELSILMPVYNEEATIERLLGADVGTGSYELLIVDDGSTDRTREFLSGREWPQQVRITYAAENRRKGQAVRTALAEARGTYAVILDADLEYDPNDLRDMLGPVRERVADVYTCFKLMPTELMRSLSLRENGFTIEAEIHRPAASRGGPHL